jgi:hypothetical protein
MQLQTQWNESMSGKTGLNYLAMFAWIARMKLDEEEENNLIHDIQTLEIAALNAMRKKQD